MKVFGYVVAFILFVVGAVFFVPGAVKNMSCKGRTVGTVVDTDSYMSYDSKTRTEREVSQPTIQYEVNGVTYEQTWGLHTNVMKYSVGQNVNLRYNENNPSVFVVDRLGGFELQHLLGAFIMVFSISFGISIKKQEV